MLILNHLYMPPPIILQPPSNLSYKKKQNAYSFLLPASLPLPTLPASSFLPYFSLYLS
jgi:hypothetical protein